MASDSTPSSSSMTDFLRDHRGRLTTPSYLVDLPGIRDQMRARQEAMQGAFSSLARLYHPYKITPLIALCRTVREMGGAAIVEDDGELKEALDDGFPGEAILFRGKDPVARGLLEGVLFEMASLATLRSLLCKTRSLMRPAKVLLRLRPNDNEAPSDGGHAVLSVGLSLQEAQETRVILDQNGDVLSLRGLCLPLPEGEGLPRDHALFLKALASSRKATDDFFEVGFIGPVPPSRSLLEEVASLVKDGRASVHIALDPGSSLAAPHCHHVTKIRERRVIQGREILSLEGDIDSIEAPAPESIAPSFLEEGSSLLFEGSEGERLPPPLFRSSFPVYARSLSGELLLARRRRDAPDEREDHIVPHSLMPFTLPVSDAIELRVLTLADVRPIHETIEAHREIFEKFLFWAASVNSENVTRDFVLQTQKEYYRNMTATYGIRYQGALAGVLDVRGLHGRGLVFTVGYWLNPSYWGRGLVTQSLRCALAYMFEKKGFGKAYLNCWTENTKSANVAKRLGFSLEGTLRQCERLGDKIIDHYQFGLLKEEFMTSLHPF